MMPSRHRRRRRIVMPRFAVLALAFSAVSPPLSLSPSPRHSSKRRNAAVAVQAFSSFSPPPFLVKPRAPPPSTRAMTTTAAFFHGSSSTATTTALRFAANDGVDPVAADESSPIIDDDDETATADAGIVIAEPTQEEKLFLAKTKQLCHERNLPLTAVKNCRDLSSVQHSPVQPGRAFRLGRCSDATSDDMDLLFDQLGIKTLVDLRSPTELKDDPTLERTEVFQNFTSMVWRERGGGRRQGGSREHGGTVQELAPNQPRIRVKRRKRDRIRDAVRGVRDKASDDFVGNFMDSEEEDDVVGAFLETEVCDDCMEEVLDDIDDDDGSAAVVAAVVGSSIDGNGSGAPSSSSASDDDDNNDKKGEISSPTLPPSPRVSMVVTADALMTNTHKDPRRSRRKERHFVSLMDEFKYVRGTLSKLRKRDIARVVLKSPGAIVSKHVRQSTKGVFLDEINDGGLPLLNELLLRFGAPGIRYVLELLADETRHPVAFYCTAGKDRTGMIAALVLSVLGVPDEDIVEDYSLSANVYAEMNDHKAMVGALSQRNLDPKTFLGAPPQVMRDTLAGIRDNYGSVEGYLDWIGFGEEKREKLRKALTE